MERPPYGSQSLIIFVVSAVHSGLWNYVPVFIIQMIHKLEKNDMIIKRYRYNPIAFHVGHVVEGEIVNQEESIPDGSCDIARTYQQTALCLGFRDPLRHSGQG
jgi:hypothetical protein